MVQSVGGEGRVGQRAFCLKSKGHRAGGRNGKRGKEGRKAIRKFLPAWWRWPKGRGRAWRLAIDTRRAPAVAIKKAFAKGASIAVVRYERRGEREQSILLGESSISGVGHLSTAMLDRCVTRGLQELAKKNLQNST